MLICIIVCNRSRLGFYFYLHIMGVGNLVGIEEKDILTVTYSYFFAFKIKMPSHLFLIDTQVSCFETSFLLYQYCVYKS